MDAPKVSEQRKQQVLLLQRAILQLQVQIPQKFGELQTLVNEISAESGIEPDQFTFNLDTLEFEARPVPSK